MGNILTLLLDSDNLLREGLKRLLEGSDFKVFAEASSLDDGRLSLAQEPDARLILVDPCSGPDEDFSGISKLREGNSNIKIVVLTSELSASCLASALEAGADGYLLKDLSSESLIQSLKLVLMGEKVFPSRLAGMLATASVSFVREENHSVPAKSGLSPREIQVLSCLVDGHSNKVIGRDLGITDATVKVHLKAALRKIDAQNRTQAAIWAISHGLGPAPAADHGAAAGRAAAA